MSASSLFVSLALVASMQTPSGCYVQLDKDTLKMGNSLVERAFIWNGGHLQTVSLTNKTTGKVSVSSGRKPDLCFTEDSNTGENASLVLCEEQGPDSHSGGLKATVEYCLPGLGGVDDMLWVRREFRIYGDAPAIQGKLFLRGSLPESADQVLDRIDFKGRHWKMRFVSFSDATDYNDNLVYSRDVIPYKRQKFPGNIVFAVDTEKGTGFFLLKEAPCTERDDPESNKFSVEYGKLTARGWGVRPADIRKDEWTEVYGTVLGVFDDSEKSALLSLRKYMKTIRRHSRGRDDMIMMNTWGDRSRDAKVGESFCLEEINEGIRLGITHFQIDDGWQKGTSPVSTKGKGSFDDIWETGDYWTPDKYRFPDGLLPVVSFARSHGIETGLWFNPSHIRDMADWEKDADTIVGLFRQYGIRYFKVDGLQIKTKTAECNLRKLFERVRKETKDSVVFNLDVTAGFRPGYFYMGEYGNIFLENRYTDFATYYPYKTLRNLWQLSRYFPPEKLQIEFLNKWRNKEKYPPDDRFAPFWYDFSYLFAITMPAQPLAWLEASNLPEEAFQIKELVDVYKTVMGEFHDGIILPIGNEPDGCSWTGFQSIVSETSGFFLVFREYTSDGSAPMETFLPRGSWVKFDPVAGDAKECLRHVSERGSVDIKLDNPNSFALFRYEIIN